MKKLGYALAIAAAAVIVALGSAEPSLAKKKKAAPPPPPAFCMDVYAPVCAVKGGKRFTYANKCFAAMDGAKTVSAGACKAVKAKKAVKKKPAAKKAAAKPAAKPAPKKDDKKK